MILNLPGKYGAAHREVICKKFNKPDVLHLMWYQNHTQFDPKATTKVCHYIRHLNLSDMWMCVNMKGTKNRFLRPLEAQFVHDNIWSHQDRNKNKKEGEGEAKQWLIDES